MRQDTGPQLAILFILILIFYFLFFFLFLLKPKINEGSSELNNEFVQADMMIKEEKT